MKTQDLEDSENVEDRREDEPAREPTGIEEVASRIADHVRAIYNTPDEEEHEGDLSDDAGYNDIKGAGNRWEQTVATFTRRAAGGPIEKPQRSTLKRLTAHPIFPQVKIVRAPVPALVGSSQDMNTVYIDPRVPSVINVNGKRVPPEAPLAVHELYERAALEVLREACQEAQHDPNGCDIYAVAHREAGEEAEQRFLEEQYGFGEEDWNAYTAIMQRMARDLIGAPGEPPPDLYTEMYPYAGEAGLQGHPSHMGEG